MCTSPRLNCLSHLILLYKADGKYLSLSSFIASFHVCLQPMFFIFISSYIKLIRQHMGILHARARGVIFLCIQKHVVIILYDSV